MKLCDTLCKMSIYFSNFSNVDLKHEVSEQSISNYYDLGTDLKYY